MTGLKNFLKNFYQKFSKKLSDFNDKHCDLSHKINEKSLLLC